MASQPELALTPAKGKPGRKPTVTAPSPAPAAKATAAPKRSAKKTASAPAQVIVRHDAGWGNSLHLRGEGAGLSWETGQPLACTGPTEWVWNTAIDSPILFKVLLNDAAWAAGENLVLMPGETITVTPAFE